MGDCKRMAAMDASTTAANDISKRRKITSPPHRNYSQSQSQSQSLTMCQLQNSMDSCSSFCSDHSLPPASCCSSNEFNDVVVDSKLVLDLEEEAKSFETVYSTPTNNKFSRETTPSSELCLESDEMDSLSAPAASLPRRLPARIEVPSEEIEEFFATAEKYEQKHFTEKYNFDFVKDVPLEGRYQWVRVKP